MPDRCWIERGLRVLRARVIRRAVLRHLASPRWYESGEDLFLREARRGSLFLRAAQLVEAAAQALMCSLGGVLALFELLHALEQAMDLGNKLQVRLVERLAPPWKGPHVSCCTPVYTLWTTCESMQGSCPPPKNPPAWSVPLWLHLALKPCCRAPVALWITTKKGGHGAPPWRASERYGETPDAELEGDRRSCHVVGNLDAETGTRHGPEAAAGDAEGASSCSHDIREVTAHQVTNART
jgi:hypothetical protein